MVRTTLVPTLPLSGVRLTPLQLAPTQPAYTVAGGTKAMASSTNKSAKYINLISLSTWLSATAYFSAQITFRVANHFLHSDILCLKHS
jgi:hypothetical protein